MTNLLTNGIGGTVGDTLATCKPLYTKSTIWYVSSVTGSNSYIGTDREHPFATLATAVTSSAANDIIVLLTGHTETLTAAQSLAKALTIVGEGTSGGKPAVSFQMNSAANLNLFSVSAANVQLRNIYIKTNLQTSSAVAVTVNASDSQFIGCYWELNTTDTGGLLLTTGADRALVKNCTFVCTNTSGAAATATPTYGLSIGSIADIEIQGTIFNGGAFGFPQNAILGATVTRLRADSLSMLNGADASLGASTTGWFNPQTVTGGSNVSW